METILKSFLESGGNNGYTISMITKGNKVILQKMTWDSKGIKYKTWKMEHKANYKNRDFLYCMRLLFKEEIGE